MDKPRVAPLVAALEAEGWSVWWDTELIPGEEFDKVTAAQLESVLAVVVVWTPISVASRWVRGEARIGADRGVLLPVRFENAQLPIDVRAFQTTDFDDWNGEAESPAFQKLLQSLNAIGMQASESDKATQAGTSAVAPKSHGQRVSICVLPFANMSGEVEQEYFSDGISEDIITDLSKVSALSVVSRNSAFMFKGKHVDLPQVARQLKVSHVLEGSVRKSGGRVRITAQLIDGMTNEHIWAERYDRDLNDIFALQDEISETIVKTLKLKLLPEEKKAIEQRGTNSLDAYNIYLMARQIYVSRNAAIRGSDAIIRLCLGAIKIDPNYARAWALMALAQAIRAATSSGSTDDGLAAAERALALDGSLAEAHAAVGRALMNRANYDGAREALEAALRLDPESLEGNMNSGLLCFQKRRYDNAIRFFEKAAALNEASPVAVGFLLNAYTAIGDREGAQRNANLLLARAQTVLAQEPDNGSAMGYVAQSLAILGEAERAKALAERVMLLDPDNFAMRYNIACTMIIHLREYEVALDLLGPALEKCGKELLNWVKTDPDFDPVRDHPRFKAMMEAAEARLARATKDGKS